MSHRDSLSRLAVAVMLAVIFVSVSFSAIGASVPVTDSPPDVGRQAVGQAQSPPTTSQPNASNLTASVVFKNQTTNGSTVTINSVVLSQPGYIALHTGAYARGIAPADTTAIAVSQRLSAGTHQNVTIDISNAPPGNAPGLNQSQLNNTQTLAVAVYADTNGNHRYDYVRSFGKNDTLVTNNGTPVRDAARVRVPSPPQPTASVVFRNQTIQNHTLTVAKARLPRGGFVIVHNASYQRTGNAVTSAVGISRYLPPGNYTNVTVRVLPGALNRTQVVTIRPSLDTNDNKQYDYVTSGGFRDVAYETRNHSGVITDPALVRVPGSKQPTRTQTRTATPSLTPTTTSTMTPTTHSSSAQGDVEGSGGLVGGFGVGEIVAILAVVVGIILVIRVVR